MNTKTCEMNVCIANSPPFLRFNICPFLGSEAPTSPPLGKGTSTSPPLGKGGSGGISGPHCDEHAVSNNGFSGSSHVQRPVSSDSGGGPSRRSSAVASLTRAAPKAIPRRRRGIAVLWVLFVLTLLSAIIGLVLSQRFAGRHLLEQRQKRLQADWLARAGIEVGIARLLDKGEPFQANITDLVPSSKVHIEAQKTPGSQASFLLRSEAFYPTGEPHPVTRTLTREVKRAAEKGQVRITTASDN